MKGDDYWIIDSGEYQHMTSSRDLLMNYQEFLEPDPVVLGDGRSVHALGTGEISITMLLGPKEKDERKSTMTKVLYVPKLAANLFSARGSYERKSGAIWTYTLLDQGLPRKGCSERPSCWQHVSSGLQSRKTRKTSVNCRKIE